MENSSIYAVFERMWQHVLIRCNNYVPTEALNDHTSDMENPHNVTAEQIGLENVDNTSDLDKPISYATQEALDKKMDLESFNDHVYNMENPHNVTKEDVGLENVNNTSDLDKPISYVTQAALDKKADLEMFDNHTSDMENPHNVTAEQIGALPITGGIMENTLTLNGIVLTEGIDYGSGDPGAGVLGQLYFKKVT